MYADSSIILHGSSCEQPAEATEEELLLNLRAKLLKGRQALLDDHEEQAVPLLQAALALKEQLWSRLTPKVQMLARRFAPYTQRHAGLNEEDLLQEGYFKFRQVIRLWDASRGINVTGWVLFSLGRHFIQLGRKGKRTWQQDVNLLDHRGRGRVSSLFCRMEIEDVLETLHEQDARRDHKLRSFRRYWFEGWTMMELARQEEVSVSTMHKWLGQTGAAFAEKFTGREEG